MLLKLLSFCIIIDHGCLALSLYPGYIHAVILYLFSVRLSVMKSCEHFSCMAYQVDLKLNLFNVSLSFVDVHIVWAGGSNCYGGYKID